MFAYNPHTNCFEQTFVRKKFVLFLPKLIFFFVENGQFYLLEVMFRKHLFVCLFVKTSKRTSITSTIYQTETTTQIGRKKSV